jgi:PAS domain S-box-containing protein
MPDPRHIAFLDRLPIGVYLSTPEGRILDANPAVIAMLGFPDRESFLATSVKDIYADPDQRARLLAQADREGSLQGVEAALRRRDGNLIWVRLNMFLERDPDGHPNFYAGTIEDVTERRLAEDALWESEARLKLLMDQLPAILWTTDLELRSTMSQGAGLASINLRPNELAGKTLFEYLQTADPNHTTIAAHRRALAGEAVSYIQDWGGRSFEAHVRPLRSSEGSVIGVLGMSLDVTDQKRLEVAARERTEALRESEERHRQLYEKERAGREQAERLRAATLALGSTLDLGEVLARILRELRGVVPYDTASIQELQGEWMEVIAGYGFPTLVGILGVRFPLSGASNPNRDVFRTRRPVVLVDAPKAYPDFLAGRLAMTPTKSWIGIPLLFGDRFIGMLALDKFEAGFYTDEHVHLAESFAAPAAIAMENARLYAAARGELEERKRVEDQFRQSQKMEAVGRLAGGIAHDFNNLLGVILGYTGLAGGLLPEDHPARAKLDQVRSAAERAAALTGQLLAFSRKQVLVPEELDLAEVIADLSAMLHRLIGEDIELVTIVPARLGVVRADRGQIGQAILNLAVNARDAMPAGGKLVIEAKNVDLAEGDVAGQTALPAGAYVMVTVGDTGVGMPPDVVAQIFEPFFTTKEPGKGTGLGLSMVYGFLTQSGGHVSVDSAVGRGTTFKLYLPRLGDDVRPSPAPAPLAEPVGGSETVLVAEDADSLREMIVEILTASGYRVLEAGTAEHALQVAQGHQGPIQLLLTDMVMPGMSGADLANAVRRVRREARVLFMSGYTDDVMIQRGILPEEASLLQKPFASDALLRKVRETLDREA